MKANNVDKHHQWHPWLQAIKDSDAQFLKYRQQVKRELQVGTLELTKKCLAQIEDKLPTASAAQSAMIYGILFDKERLQAGESTQNIEIHSEVEIESLGALAEALRQSLLERHTESV